MDKDLVESGRAAITPSWERLSGETDRAYAAFCSYRNMKPSERSIWKAWQSVTKNMRAKKAHGHWYEWSAEHSWIQRTADWDNEVERRALLRLSEHLIDDKLNLLAAARGALPALKKRLETLNADEMSIREMTQLMARMGDLFTKFDNTKRVMVGTGSGDDDDSEDLD